MSLWFGILLLAIIRDPVAAAESRMWSPAGGPAVEAEFLGLEKDQVVLARVADSTRIKIALAQLGPEDRVWLADRASSRSKPLDAKQLAARVEIPENDGGVIRLPLRVHLIHGIEMKKDGVSMRMWVTPKQVEEAILPEINRIWKQAAIEWTLESVIDRPFEKNEGHQAAITLVQNSSRGDDGEAEKQRAPAIRALSGAADAHPVIHNLYLFPYLGSTFQGFADMRGNTAFLGVWTNKPSQGKKPPERCLLVENEPMNIGSIGRTAGHELGHNLGLNHPDRKTQTEFHRLMGGHKQGYRLLPEEIKLARTLAIERARRIQAAASK